MLNIVKASIGRTNHFLLNEVISKMIDYRISFDQINNRFVIESEDIIEGSIAVNIPDSDKRKRQFISLFLHKADVEEGLDFLHCISMDKHIQVNRALFISALTNLMKCFQSTSVCNMLSEERFSRAYPTESQALERFKNWRNKHFIHDENAMRNAIAFLFVTPEGCENPLGGLPSVIWNRTPIDFLSEGRQLEVLMQALWRFIREEIDKVGAAMLEEYKAKTREELLEYGISTITLATTDDSNKARNTSIS